MQTVESTPVNVPIRAHNVGFQVVSALVDNNSSQYAFVPAAGSYIPPGVTRYALAMAPTWAELEILWTGPPPGTVVGPVQSPQEALIVTWSDDPALGAGTASNTYTPPTPQRIVATLPFSPGSVSVVIPTGAKALGIVQAITAGTAALIRVVGAQSGLTYIDTTDQLGQGSCSRVGAIFAVDSAVTVTQNFTGNTGSLYVVAIFDNTVTDVTSAEGGTLPVTVAGSGVDATGRKIARLNNADITATIASGGLAAAGTLTPLLGSITAVDALMVLFNTTVAGSNLDLQLGSGGTFLTVTTIPDLIGHYVVPCFGYLCDTVRAVNNSGVATGVVRVSVIGKIA